MGCASSAPLAPGAQTGVANDAPPFDMKPNGESTLVSKLKGNAQDLMDSDHMKQVIGNKVDGLKDGSKRMMNDVGDKMNEAITATEEKLSSTFTNLTSAAENKMDEAKDKMEEVADEANEKMDDMEKDVDTMVEDLEKVLPPAEMMESSGKNSPTLEQEKPPSDQKNEAGKDSTESGENPSMDENPAFSPAQDVEIIGVIVTEISFVEPADCVDNGYNADGSMTSDDGNKQHSRNGSGLLEKPKTQIHDDLIGSPPPMPRYDSDFDPQIDTIETDDIQFIESSKVPTRPVSTTDQDRNGEKTPIDGHEEEIVKNDSQKNSPSPDHHERLITPVHKDGENEDEDENKHINEMVNEIIESNRIEIDKESMTNNPIPNNLNENCNEDDKETTEGKTEIDAENESNSSVIEFTAQETNDENELVKKNDHEEIDSDRISQKSQNLVNENNDINKNNISWQENSNINNESSTNNNDDSEKTENKSENPGDENGNSDTEGKTDEDNLTNGKLEDATSPIAVS